MDTSNVQDIVIEIPRELATAFGINPRVSSILLGWGAFQYLNQRINTEMSDDEIRELIPIFRGALEDQAQQ